MPRTPRNTNFRLKVELSYLAGTNRTSIGGWSTPIASYLLSGTSPSIGIRNRVAGVAKGDPGAGNKLPLDRLFQERDRENGSTDEGSSNRSLFTAGLG